MRHMIDYDDTKNGGDPEACDTGADIATDDKSGLEKRKSGQNHRARKHIQHEGFVSGARDEHPFHSGTCTTEEWEGEACGR